MRLYNLLHGWQRHHLLLLQVIVLLEFSYTALAMLVLTCTG